MLIFKGSQVIKYYVMFEFLFVQTVCWNVKGAFSRAKISAKVFAKVACLAIYCNDFSRDYNGFSISIDSYNVLNDIYFEN